MHHDPGHRVVSERHNPRMARPNTERNAKSQRTQLEEAIRSATRQAIADGLPIDSTDARGCTQLLRHLGFDDPNLASVAPAIARLFAELMVIDAAVGRLGKTAETTTVDWKVAKHD